MTLSKIHSEKVLCKYYWLKALPTFLLTKGKNFTHMGISCHDCMAFSGFIYLYPDIGIGCHEIMVTVQIISVGNCEYDESK